MPRILKKELWPFSVTVNEGRGQLDEDLVDTSDAEGWLVDCVGPFRQNWNVVYEYDRVVYYFKTGENATLFVLRWQ